MILGIDDKDFLNPNIIKLIDSIAGAGKSSITHQFLKSNGIEYLRLTSTNNLKKSAEEQYGMPCHTIASTLFTNEYPNFYSNFKEPTIKTIVIDECLQASPRIFEWCNEYVGRYNIIITTDSHQMLAPDETDSMMTAFNAFIDQTNVLTSTITTTKRARDQKTADAFSFYYAIATSEKLFSVNDLSKYKTINYNDMQFSPNNVYITHTNKIEQYFYKERELHKNHDVDLLPKGYIASKNVNLFKYPILSQLDAESSRAKSYVQIANIASATRYQGNECMSGSKLYFIITPESKISSRELYTVITRLWTIDDFVVVLCDDLQEQSTINTFKGLPVKRKEVLKIDYDAPTKYCTRKELDEVFEQYPDTNEVFYDKDIILSTDNQTIAYYLNNPHNPTSQHGKALRLTETSYMLPQDKNDYKNKTTASSLVRRDSSLNYSFVPSIYKELEKHGVDLICAPHRLNSFASKSKYQVDFFSAYPMILKHTFVPIDGFLTYQEDSALMNFYLYKGDKLTRNSILTDELNEYVQDNNLGETVYLFSTPKKQGCYPGDYLYEHAHKSIESKAAIKGIHYGYYQKRLLTKATDNSCYIINDHQKYELLMVAICSTLLYYAYLAFDAVNGDYIKVDAVYFDNYDDTTVLKLDSALPKYVEWRILENETKEIIVQNYTPLQSAKDIENAKRRESRKTDEYRAKNAERNRIARAKKKLAKESEA